MDDLEKELLNYNDMGTSIEKIKNREIENKELSRDLNTYTNKSQKCNVSNKKFNINNFVQELENNLDNFDNTEESTEEDISPIASNQYFNKVREEMTEKLINFEDEKDNSNNFDKKLKDSKKLKELKELKELTELKESKEKYQNFNNKLCNFLINIKEPMIIILLFILLNNRDLIILIYRLPFIKNIESQYPSLIIRGIILASIIYYLRKL